MIIGVGIDVVPIERFAATDGDGRPHLDVRGTVAEQGAKLGVTRWHVSLSHDGGIASATVIAEGD